MTRPNCSLTRNHSSIDQPCPPCSRREAAAVQPRGDRRALDLARRSRPAAARRAPRPRARAASARSRRTRALAAGARAARRSAQTSWSAAGAVVVIAGPFAWSSVVELRSVARSAGGPLARRGRAGRAAGCGGWRSRRSHARGRRRTSGSRSPAVRVDQLDDAVQVVEPAALAAVQQQPLDPAALALDRVRAAAPAAGAASRRPRGSSRSGSGVTESQDDALDHARRLTATDHKVRMSTNMEPATTSSPALRAPRARRGARAPRLYLDPELLERRAGADLRAHLAARRARLARCRAPAAT